MHRTSVRPGVWEAAPTAGRRRSIIHSCRQTGAGGSDPEQRGETGLTRSRHHTLSRVLISVTAMMVLVLALASGVAARDSANGSIKVVVDSGDTLWDLAVEATPPGGDVRATVFEIRENNGLTRSELRPGQALTIPAVP